MTQVGNVYGEALYDLAKEEGLGKEILEQLTVLCESFSQEPDFLRLLSAPNVPKQERCQIVDDSFQGKLHPYTLNFLKILTEKGYVKCFHDCCAAYREHYYQDNGILPVTAVSAVPLNESQSEKLTAKLSGLTGKTILLTNRIEPGVIGGVRLDYNGRRLDDTVAHRLETIRTMLKTEVL